MNKLKREIKEFRLLMACVPSATITLFVMSVIGMNLFANKSINLPFSWLALDCGLIFSWFTFMSMDVLTKHFGPKASTQLSLVAIGFNLLFCMLFLLGSRIPGVWGESYVDGSEAIINTALDNTFGGTWYVLLGSTIAFAVSAIVNNFSNHLIGKAFSGNPNSFGAYALRAYGSTAIGQFVDNLTFALLVSHFFFGWTMLQCFTCALTGMVVELLFELVFSYFGYRECERWRHSKIGEAYFAFREKGAENP